MSKELKWEENQVIEYGKVISVRLDLETSNKVKELAKKCNIKGSTVVRRIVKDYFDNDYEEN